MIGGLMIAVSAFVAGVNVGVIVAALMTANARKGPGA